MTEYNNSLDSWYQQCPWPVQQVLEWPYQKTSEALRWITGDPNRVAGYAPTYDAIAQRVQQLGAEVESARAGIGMWDGQARMAFDAKMRQVRQNLESLAPAISQTQEILRSAAETSVSCANLILDIIRGVIEFLVSSLAVAGALAVFTAGASAVAWVAANLAKGAQALATVLKGVERAAKVLQALARALTKIQAVMKKVADVLKAIRELFLAIQKAKKGAGLVDKALLTALAAPIKIPTTLAGNAALGGVSAVTGVPGLSMPGGVGEVLNAGGDATDAVGSSNEAVGAAR
ncbi:WXG100 family type VII secretion target [Tessaracoccus sp. MC1865]|uniref:WXG100 family type VII secretion target n=1 Tax=unclassified Tessaracoccus TaxID=2635419 RepID=UPI001602A00B|nr:WXG100 family type VII secretion target [Tessaracoccus sp. MC1865]MBB1484491.1 WXG100 family type VII secretion target [Tessaracoccus sp. MC1865]MBB1509361.1 WXG100 family type VII secretion target [Tessaracoccus sp. MC1756]QTO38408.1 WXG100 family type VII secretion target [Tessaracoccus sp. MC1865]